MEQKKTNPLPPQENKSSKQPNSALSPRQMEVLVLITQGLSGKKIANKLKISISTVKGTITMLYQALGATNAVSAFRIALEMGILNIENPVNNQRDMPTPFREVVVYQRRRGLTETS